MQKPRDVFVGGRGGRSRRALPTDIVSHVYATPDLEKIDFEIHSSGIRNSIQRDSCLSCCKVLRSYPLLSAHLLNDRGRFRSCILNAESTHQCRSMESCVETVVPLVAITNSKHISDRTSMLLALFMNHIP